MKIVDTQTTVVGAPWRELTFVELKTDEGLVGLGEVRMVNKTDTLLACIRELAPRHVIGTDPFDVERLAWNVQVAEYGRPGEIAMSALAAFEVACWDLVGQALGVPVWKLLGGQFRTRVPAYANGWYQTERDPEAMADAARAVVERGYRALKLDPFGAASGGLTREELRFVERIVVAVRQAVGPDVELMLEMHGRFTPSAAAQIGRTLEELEPAWLEEPIPPENPAALRRVREAVGTMANLHLAACTPNVRVLEHFNDFADQWMAELVDEAPTVSVADGCFSVPDRPGLGLMLDHDACAAHPRTGGRIELFEQGWELRGRPQRSPA